MSDREDAIEWIVLLRSNLTMLSENTLLKKCREGQKSGVTVLAVLDVACSDHSSDNVLCMDFRIKMFDISIPEQSRTKKILLSGIVIRHCYSLNLS